MTSLKILNEDDANSTHALKQKRSLIFQAILFLATFILLHGLWIASRGSWVEHFAINTMTVTIAVAQINFLTPAIGASAIENRIDAPGGGINIANGCEGTDALFLLVAAIVACPFPWHARVRGVLIGSLLVLALNQIRIVILFYAFRNDKELFDLLHHAIAPIAMIVAASLFFLAWTRHHARHDADV